MKHLLACASVVFVMATVITVGAQSSGTQGRLKPALCDCGGGT
jgi:hypothetical protein